MPAIKQDKRSPRFLSAIIDHIRRFSASMHEKKTEPGPATVKKAAIITDKAINYVEGSGMKYSDEVWERVKQISNEDNAELKRIFDEVMGEEDNDNEQ